MEKFWNYFVIALGSAIGGVGRCWLSGLMAQRFGDAFPWGTLLVNVSGSFLIGWFAALAGPESRLPVSPRLSLFFMPGLCGGYTTFSSFSLQTLRLVQGGEWLQAGVNALLSFLLCLLAVWVGHLAGQLFKS